MYKVRITNPYIFMNSIIENKNPQFENFSKNELIEMLNILLDEYRDCYQRVGKTIEFGNYLLENREIEIDGNRYFKHECDDIITNKFLSILKGEKDE